VANAHTSELQADYLANRPELSPENCCLPVAEQPTEKMYGRMDPLLNSHVEYYNKKLEKGDDQLYRNEQQLLDSARHRELKRINALYGIMSDSKTTLSKTLKMLKD